MPNVCTSCAVENPDPARFCMACGAALGVAPPTEERRLVTILFADLVGFTQRSDHADPEDVRRTLIPFHRAAKEEIERHGGVLDKFIGDAAMGVFGAPVTHDDDPVRAVRAARALLARVEELRGTVDPKASIRVAVNTGEAVVTSGTGPQLGEGVAGDVVNTASRMQSLAPSDGLVVGDLTWSVVDDRFRGEALAPVTVKGKSEPLRVWQITEERAISVAAVAPLVGRRDDLAFLRDAGASVTASRSARIVTLVADPGLGKTRLLEEYRAVAARDGVTWWSAGFAPYGDEGAFRPLAELLAQAVAGDGPADAHLLERHLGRVLAACAADPDDDAWLRARLDAVLGLERPSASSLGEMPADIGRAVGRVLAACVAGPTVLALEDVHWAEPTVRSVLLAALPSMVAVPALALCTARPELFEGEDAAPWNVHGLAPLGDEETMDLVRALQADASMDEREIASLASRSGGNPLFAQEFVRTLRDAGPGSDPGEVPTSIRAVIGARLDGLSTRSRAVVLDAAVVGDTFWPGVLEALADGQSASPTMALDDLVHRGVVTRRVSSRLAGHTAYGFSHALIHEEAYGRLPRGVRARKHLAVGRWLTDAAGADRDRFADALARQFFEAAETARADRDEVLADEARPPAIRWLLQAAGDIFRLDPGRTFDLAARALELSPEGEQLEQALYWSGIGGRRAGRLPAVEVRDRFERALASARERGDPSAVGTFLTRVGSQLGAMGESGAAVSAYDEAIGLLESLPAGRPIAAAYVYRAEEEMFAGHPEPSLELVRKGLSVARDGGFDDLVIMGLHLRGDARCSLGDPRGMEDLHEALDLSRRSAGASEIVTSLTYVADWQWQLEGPRVGRVGFEEALRLAEDRGAVSQGLWSKADLSMVLAELGEWDRVLELTGQLLSTASELMDAALKAAAHALYSTILLRRERRADAEERLDVLTLAEGTHELQALAPALGYAAEVAAADGDRAATLMAIERLLERTHDAVSVYRAVEAPRLCRAALAVGEAGLAHRVVEMLDELRTTREQLFADTARAIVLEGDGDHQGAFGRFTDVRERWAAYGHVWEEAQAALGVWRCGVALGRSDEAATAERHAATLLSRLGVPAA